MLFVALLALSATVTASPVERQTTKAPTVPLKHVSNVTNFKSLVDRAQARLNKINGGVTSRAVEGRQSSGSATNEFSTYVVPVTIGDATWDLIVDTGSSNTWCGAQSSCEPSSTGRYTGGEFSVPYGSGSVYGDEYIDTVSFGGLTVTSQSIGSAVSSDDFNGVDGILGLGPVDLTETTISNANSIPTFLDNLKKQGSISTEVLGVYFKPEAGSDSDDNNGELTLGGVDTTKYTGALTYFPKLTTGPAAPYWGISGRISFGTTVLATSFNGIVDTGTTLILLPPAAYNTFLSVSGGYTSSNRDFPTATWTTKPTQNLSFTFGSTTYTLTPAQYLVPEAEYSFVGLAPGKYYSWIQNSNSKANQVNAIIGQKFLENYYSVYDTTNSRIGFATRA